LVAVFVAPLLWQPPRTAAAAAAAAATWHRRQ
jgi:hypothetical protein